MSNCQKCSQKLDNQASICSNCGQIVTVAPPIIAAESSEPPEQIANKQKINGFAIASLVFGILAITGLFGIIFAIIAMGQIGAGFGPTRGRRLAMAGLVVSIFWPMVVLLYPNNKGFVASYIDGHVMYLPAGSEVTLTISAPY